MVRHGRLDERREEAPRRRVGGVERLGVPLHGDGEVLVGQGALHGLDEPVGGDGGDEQPLAEPPDPLVVQAVHGELGEADDPGEPRGLVAEAHRVGEVVAGVALAGEVVVLHRGGHLAGEVLVEGAAGGDVEDLQPAADAEDRLAVLGGPAHEQQLELVARRVAPVAAGAPRVVVARRVEVGAAGEEDAVERVVDGARGGLVVGDQGDHQRHPARLGHRADVALAHRVRRRQGGGDPVHAVERLRGDADEGALGHAVSLLGVGRERRARGEGSHDSEPPSSVGLQVIVSYSM